MRFSAVILHFGRVLVSSMDCSRPLYFKQMQIIEQKIQIDAKIRICLGRAGRSGSYGSVLTETYNLFTFLFRPKYRFSIHSDLNLFYVVSKRNYTGATHSDDISYVFQCVHLGFNLLIQFMCIQLHFIFVFFFSRHTFDKINMYAEHLQKKDVNYDIIMRMVKMITNFARNGYEYSAFCFGNFQWFL